MSEMLKCHRSAILQLRALVRRKRSSRGICFHGDIIQQVLWQIDDLQPWNLNDNNRILSTSDVRSVPGEVLFLRGASLTLRGSWIADILQSEFSHILLAKLHSEVFFLAGRNTA